MNKILLYTIVFLNLVGIIIGTSTYYRGLIGTHPIVWIFLLDCPLAAALFTISLWKKVFRPIAFVAIIKYSFWTFLAYLFYWTRFVSADTIQGAMILILGHIGMVAEALVFGYQKIGNRYLIAMLSFFLVNDLVDYFYTMDFVLPDRNFVLPLLVYNLISTVSLSALVRRFGWKGWLEQKN
jgi:uncharacterized membrane protein YpjA